MLQLIYKKFEFLSRKTSLKKEIIGGITTFFAMIYILPVNSNILSENNKIMPYGGVFVATAIVSAFGSILVGMFSNIPIGIAPGMGSNIFFVSTMIKQFNLDWTIALSVVIINGVFFTALALTGVLDKFIKSIPQSIKYAFVISLGIYLSFVGLKGSGIASITSTGFKLGDIKKITVLLSWIGIFVTFILTIAKVKMSILISLISMAFVGIIFGEIIPNNANHGLSSFSDMKFNYSDFNKFGNVFGKGITSIPKAITKVAIYPSLLALIFMTLSGSSGIIVSIGEMANLKDEKNQIKGSKKALIGIGISSSMAGVIGTSPTGGFLESNAGIAAGSRTGFSSIIIGILFLISIPMYPILQPLFNHQFVTAPILMYVGSMMMTNAKKIKWSNPAIASSSFILLIITIFTSSILNGMAFGIVSFVLFEMASGNWKKINLNMYIFAFLFTIYIITIPFIF